MTNTIQGLWIGNELSNIELLSINSFIRNGHTYHLYCILVDNRKELSDYLRDCNIEALSHWPKGLHEYQHTPNSTKELTNTKIITNQTLSLPCSPFLHKDEQDYIIEHIIKFYEET